MKFYLDHKEVTADEFEQARKKGFDPHMQWSVELEEHEYEMRDSWEGSWREFVTLALCGALTAYGLVQLWQWLKTVPL